MNLLYICNIDDTYHLWLSDTHHIWCTYNISLPMLTGFYRSKILRPREYCWEDLRIGPRFWCAVDRWNQGETKDGFIMLNYFPGFDQKCWIIHSHFIFHFIFFWFCLKQWLCQYIGHIMNVSWWTPRKQLLVAWSLKRFGRMRSRRACQVEDSGRNGRNSSQTCSISDGNLSIRRRNSGILDEVFQTSDALNDKKVLYSALHLLFEHLNFSMFARRP